MTYRAFVSGAEFSRDIAEILMGTRGLRTFSCPRSIRTVGPGAFHDVATLRSVVLNEGVETICGTVFHNSGLQRITVPRTLRDEDGALSSCETIRTIWVEDGSAVKLPC